MARISNAARLTDEAPETMSQAHTWVVTANAYEADGLCRGCAGQAAYGHQLGFSRVHPPCDTCQPIVDTFPVDAGQATPWRKFAKGKTHDREDTTA